MARWLLVGPRGSRRIAALQAALREQGSEPAQLLDYEQLLADPSLLAQALARNPGAMVKLESPGEAPELHAALVRRGWQLQDDGEPEPASTAHGELAWQNYWYAGFTDLLAALPMGAHYFNAPDELVVMSDKLACQQRLIAAGVSVPPLFGLVSGYEEMRERLRDRGCERAFLKARYGSSGAGVLAYARNRAGKEFAYGSAELVREGGRDRVFNSLRQRRYAHFGDIARLVDLLATQGAYLEQWIPKPAAPVAGIRHFDVRVVAFEGRARQRVARVSDGPLTNLHLGNRRGELESWLDAAAMAGLESATAGAARCFPGSRMIGFDLIVRGRRSWVLEANGFGDLLPGLLHEGRTTYQDQAALFARRADALAMPADV